MTRTDQRREDQRPAPLSPHVIRTEMPVTERPLGYSVASLSAWTEISKQTIYREIDAGNLRAKRVRGRLVIPAEAVAEWLNS